MQAARINVYRWPDGSLDSIGVPDDDAGRVMVCDRRARFIYVVTWTNGLPSSGSGGR